MNRAGDGLKVAGVEGERIDVAIPAHDIEGMVIENDLVETVVMANASVGWLQLHEGWVLPHRGTLQHVVHGEAVEERVLRPVTGVGTLPVLDEEVLVGPRRRDLHGGKGLVRRRQPHVAGRVGHHLWYEPTHSDPLVRGKVVWRNGPAEGHERQAMHCVVIAVHIDQAHEVPEFVVEVAGRTRRDAVAGLAIDEDVHAPIDARPADREIGV